VVESSLDGHPHCQTTQCRAAIELEIKVCFSYTSGWRLGSRVSILRRGSDAPYSTVTVTAVEVEPTSEASPWYLAVTG
jgi:hypothetical protein